MVLFFILNFVKNINSLIQLSIKDICVRYNKWQPYMLGDMANVIPWEQCLPQGDIGHITLQAGQNYYNLYYMI